jgi:hypothetical protein
MRDRLIILILGIALGLLLKWTIGPKSIFRAPKQDESPAATAPAAGPTESRDGRP